MSNAEEKPKNLYQKLIEVRKKVPYIKKDSKSFGYDYASGTSVLGSLKSEMDAQGVLLFPKIISKEITEVEVKTKSGIKTQIQIKLDMIYTWVNSDNPEETLEVPFFAVACQDDPSKAFGSALTYTERYFLLKFFQIATDKDDPDSFKKEHGLVQKAPDELRNKIVEIVKKNNVPVSVETIINLSKEKAEEYLEKLEVKYMHKKDEKKDDELGQVVDDVFGN